MTAVSGESWDEMSQNKIVCRIRGIYLLNYYIYLFSYWHRYVFMVYLHITHMYICLVNYVIYNLNLLLLCLQAVRRNCTSETDIAEVLIIKHDNVSPSETVRPYQNIPF